MLVKRFRGTPADLIARTPSSPWRSIAAWVFAPAQPTLVLGSAQRDVVVDADAAVRLGVTVVRRNSGGGAVLLLPDRCLWIDVLLPPEDPRWVEDVGRSPIWLGETWAMALGRLRVEASVHYGPLERTSWNRLICFGALGPGEVSIGGRKVVGISSRRTRDGARFQCLVHQEWNPAPLADLIVQGAGERERAVRELADVASGPGVPLEVLESGFLAALDNRARSGGP